MGLITQKPNYSIAGGDTTFEGIQAVDKKMSILIKYTGILTADVQAYLEQSLNGTDWNSFPGTATLIDKTKTSLMYSIDTQRGLFIRVGIIQGTDITGVIDAIDYLT